jgi:hypothetical protein
MERIGDACVDFLIVTLLFASGHIRSIVGLQAASQRPYAYSYVRLVPQLMYDLHCTSGLARASFSFFSGHGFCNGGPLAGVKETISKSRCGCMHVGRDLFLTCIALAAT